MLFGLLNRMVCVAKIVKNRIRQQYPSVFWTLKTIEQPHRPMPLTVSMILIPQSLSS
jgi:hypothetical protein